MAVKFTTRAKLRELQAAGQLKNFVVFAFEYQFGIHYCELFLIAESRADAAKFLRLWRRARRAVRSDCPYTAANHVLGVKYPELSLRWLASRPFLRLWVDSRYYEYRRANRRMRAIYVSSTSSRLGYWGCRA